MEEGRMEERKIIKGSSSRSKVKSRLAICLSGTVHRRLSRLSCPAQPELCIQAALIWDQSQAHGVELELRWIILDPLSKDVCHLSGNQNGDS
jgi:hypothetical protein